MNLKKIHTSVLSNSFKSFLILVLTFFLGIVTSCDFKHSIQHQFGFEITSNQNISKTTLDENCGRSYEVLSESNSSENSSEIKSKRLKGLNQTFFRSNYSTECTSSFFSAYAKQLNLKTYPLFILYKRRKVNLISTSI
jgi:hypothetical protein